MNKTVIFITFAVLVLVGLAGAIVLLILRPDATATFTGLLITLLAIVVNAAGSFYMLGKIEKQTNGTLSIERAHNAALTGQLVDLGVRPAEPPVAVVKPGDLGSLTVPVGE